MTKKKRKKRTTPKKAGKPGKPPDGGRSGDEHRSDYDGKTSLDRLKAFTGKVLGVPKRSPGEQEDR